MPPLKAFATTNNMTTDERNFNNVAQKVGSESSALNVTTDIGNVHAVGNMVLSDDPNIKSGVQYGPAIDIWQDSSAQFSIEEDIKFYMRFADSAETVIIPNTTNTVKYKSFKNYRYYNILPVSEADNGATAWLGTESKEITVAQYGMFHAWSKEAITYGDGTGAAANEIYLAELVKNEVRIKSKLLSRKVFRTGSQLFPSGIASYTSIDVANEFSLKYLGILRSTLMLLPGAMSTIECILPMGEIEAVYTAAKAEGYSVANDRIHESWVNGAVELNIIGYHFEEDRYMKVIPKGENNENLNLINTKTDVAHALIYLPNAVTLTGRAGGTQKTSKAYGTLAAFDMNNTFASEAIRFWFGCAVTSPEKAINYYYSTAVGKITQGVEDNIKAKVISVIQDNMSKIKNLTFDIAASASPQGIIAITPTVLTGEYTSELENSSINIWVRSKTTPENEALQFKVPLVGGVITPPMKAGEYTITVEAIMTDESAGASGSHMVTLGAPKDVTVA